MTANNHNHDPYRLTEYSILRTVLVETLIGKRPLDPVLNALLRERKSMKEDQRQRFRETVAAVFRWWGVLRRLLHRDDLKVLEAAHGENPRADQKISISDRSAAALLLGAMLLDRIPETRYRQKWSRLLALPRIPDLPRDTYPEDYAAALCRELAGALGNRTVGAGFGIDDVIPAWCDDFLPAEFPVEKLAAWTVRRPPLWLRAQGIGAPQLAAALERQGVRTQCHPAVAAAIRVGPTPINLYTLEQFRSGLFEIQDLASQSIALACSPQPGERWWDPCAGAGGKTLALASQMNNRGTVVAGDIRGYKLDSLRRRARRAGFSNIECREWDGKPLRRKQQGKFDGVLVDAPCSCSGTWRRNPDAKWSTDPGELEELNRIQTEILQAAASGVAPGGILVYATCSIFTIENEQVVDAFLARNSNFAVEEFTAPPTGEKCAGGILRVNHWDGDCDAMFMARMRRRK